MLSIVGLAAHSSSIWANAARNPTMRVDNRLAGPIGLS
jgi:hypothetical protein